MPLIGVHGSHVLTIEGIGNSANPHPLQERFGKAGWFQCSMCASGIIMAFYAQLRAAYEDPERDGGLTEKEVEEGFDGNLCRCTGYRCLLDVAKTFAVDHKPLPNILIREGVESPKTNGHGSEKVNGHATTNGKELDEVDPDVLAKKPEDDFIPIKEATAVGGGKGTATGILEKDQQAGAPVLCGKGADCCKNKPGSGCNGGEGEDDAKKTIPGIPVFEFKPYQPDAEPIFPPWLKKYRGFRDKDLILVQKRKEPLLAAVDDDEDSDVDSVDGKTAVDSDASSSPLGNVWLRPGSMASLMQTMRRYPGAKIRSGNTETGIEVRFKASRFAVSVYVSDHIRELATLSSTDEGLLIGSALPLTDLIKACKALKSDPEHQDKRQRVMLYDAILDNLQHFASNQIRNVACVAGNITTASPISDLNPIWVASGATLKYVDVDSDDMEEKSVNMRDFFLGYRKTALPTGAVVTNLFVPYPDEVSGGRKVFTRAYKQSKRKDDDIAIVTCCLRAEVEGKKITDIRLVYGGMAPTTVESKETQGFLTGKDFGDDTAFYGALERLSGVDFPLQFGVPGGMAVYRKSLAMGFFAKFWTEVTHELGIDIQSEMTNLSELLDSEIHRGLCTGNQDLEDVVLAKKAGQSIPHLAHLKHVTGEAQYCDDIPKQHNELIGALVFSQKPHARIISIDSEFALNMEGVADFITIKDLPGSNIWNPPAMDEVLFAEEEVFTCGQVIGVVLAETKNQAQAAARAIKVEYEELPYILTIDEAIAAESYFKPRPKLERGDISKIDQADHVLEGWWRMGGQEQFYIETNATLAIPHPEDEMEVYSSTQNPSETQVFVASGESGTE
jgi:xanthine dehydrogenase/oxidase